MNMIIYPKKHYAPKYDEWHIAEMYNPEENEFHLVLDCDDNFILMQFTWLLDKNWKEIYEGDFILCKQKWQEKNWKVIFTEWWFWWDFWEWKSFLNECVKRFSGEVTWNIYENPELLTK